MITVVGRPKTILARLYGSNNKSYLRKTAGWITAADLDLLPFYRSVDVTLKPLIRHLRGLKPPRTATAHEALIIAFTEQQITTRLARTFQNRMVLKYGKPFQLGELKFHTFPSPHSLASASKEDLKHLGLSRNKADFIVEASRSVASGELDLEALKGRPTTEAREVLLSIKGVGEWTADYVLSRGLGRPEMVPYYDLGARDTIGLFTLAGGGRSLRRLRRSSPALGPMRASPTGTSSTPASWGRAWRRSLRCTPNHKQPVEH